MASNTNNAPQEIDLLDLFQRIGTGIKNIFVGFFRFLLFLLVFGFRKAHFLVLFLGAGALIGLLLFSSTKRYYSSYMVAQANGITSADMINYINDLHELCKKNNAEALAFDLQMQDSTARKVKDIQAYFIVDADKDGIGDFVDFKNSFNPKDTSQIRLEDRFHVSVEVYDNKAFSNVRNGLFRYMRKNPYIIKLNEIRKQELTELISKTEYEIAKLDSLQNTDYFKSADKFRSQQSQMMFLAEKEPTMYYKDKLSLVSRKQAYTKELELATEAFTVIKDFTNLAVAENPKSSYLVKYALILGLLGYIFLLLIYFRKPIFKFTQIQSWS
jgi:hypothetical protein